MAIEYRSISKKTTYTGELTISWVAPVLRLNSRQGILFPDPVMHRLLRIRLLLTPMTTQGKTLWIPRAKRI